MRDFDHRHLDRRRLRSRSTGSWAANSAVAPGSLWRASAREFAIACRRCHLLHVVAWFRRTARVCPRSYYAPPRRRLRSPVISRCPETPESRPQQPRPQSGRNARPRKPGTAFHPGSDRRARLVELARPDQRFEIRDRTSVASGTGLRPSNPAAVDDRVLPEARGGLHSVRDRWRGPVSRPSAGPPVGQPILTCSAPFRISPVRKRGASRSASARPRNLRFHGYFSGYRDLSSVWNSFAMAKASGRLGS